MYLQCMIPFVPPARWTIVMPAAVSWSVKVLLFELESPTTRTVLPAWWAAMRALMIGWLDQTKLATSIDWLAASMRLQMLTSIEFGSPLGSGPKNGPEKLLAFVVWAEAARDIGAATSASAARPSKALRNMDLVLPDPCVWMRESARTPVGARRASPRDSSGRFLLKTLL